MNDPLESYWSADVSATADLRQAILETTLCVVRRRRVVRRLGKLGMLAASFVAGAASMGLWQSERPENHPVEVIASRFETPQVAAVEPPPSLIDLEWQAFDSRDNRAALFFEVARRYLEDEQDYTSALRCYLQALDAAPKEDLAIRPEDTWLVMALKEARQKGDE